MANYDSDITLDVGLDIEKAKSTAAGLNKDLERIFSKGVKSDSLTGKFKSLQAQAEKLSQKSQEIVGKLQQLEGQKVPTEKYKDLQADITQADNELQKLLDKQMKFDAIGVNKSSRSYKSLLYDINNAKFSLQQLKDVEQQYKNDGTAYTSGVNTEEYKKLGAELNDVNNKLLITRERLQAVADEGGSGRIAQFGSVLSQASAEMRASAASMARQVGSSMAQLGSNIASTIKRIDELKISLLKLAGNRIIDGIRKIRSQFKGLGRDAKSSNSGLQIGFKTFLKYGLGVRSMYMLMRKLRSAIMDGLKNLAQADSTFNASMSQIKSSLEWIKNSFAAMIAPLIETLAPVIQSIAEKLVSIMRTAGQFIAAITGKQARQAEYVYIDYAKSLDKSAKSTKKLNKESKELEKTIAGFDDVQLLKKADKDEELDPEDELDYAFSPQVVSVPMSNLADKFKKFFKDIFDVIKQAWDAAGPRLVESFKRALGAVKTLLSDIAQTFHDVFVDGYGFDWLVSLFDLLSTIFDIITAIATVFDQAWNDDNRGYNYIASIFTMFTAINLLLQDIGKAFIDAWNSGSGYALIASILELFTNINLTIAAIADAFREMWNDDNRGYNLIKAFLDMWTSINLLLNDIVVTLKTAFENEPGKAFIASILELFTDIFNMINSIATAFKNVWNNGSGYELVVGILNAWSEINRLLNDVAIAFTNAFQSPQAQFAIQGIFDLLTTVLGVIESIAASFRTAWNDNNAGQTYIQSLLDRLGSILSLLDSIATAFRKAWDSGVGVSILSRIFSILTYINNALSNISKNVQSAWEESGRGVQIWQNILAPIDTALKHIQSMAQTTADWAANIDFGPIMTAFENLTSKIDPLVDVIGDGLQAAYENVLLPLASWTIESGVPVVLDALSAALELLATALEAVKPGVAWIWDNVIHPLASGISELFVAAMKDITNVLNGLVDWIKNNSELVTNFVKIFGTFILTWLGATGIPAIITGIVGALGALIGAINPIILGISAVAAGIAWLVTNWEKVVETVKGAIEAVKEFFFVSQEDLQVTREDLPKATFAVADLKSAMVEYGTANEAAKEDLVNLMLELDGFEKEGKSTEEIVDIVRQRLKDAGISMEDFGDIMQATGQTSATVRALVYGLTEETENLKEETEETKPAVEETTTAIQKSGDAAKDTESDFGSLSTHFQESVKEYESGTGKMDTATEKLGTTTQTVTSGIEGDYESSIRSALGEIDALQEGITGHDGLSKATENLGSTTKTITDDVKTAWQQAKKDVSGSISDTKSAVTQDSNSMKATVTSDNKTIQSDADTQWKLVKSRTVEYFGGLVTSVQQKSYTLSTDVQFIFQQMATKIPEKFDGVGDLIVDKFSGITNRIQNLFTNFSPIDTYQMRLKGEEAAQQLAEGFKSIHIPTPHMNISGWNSFDNGNGGFIYTPNFVVDWYAKGGFPKNGELFVGNENGIEAMGKMGNKNVVANNQQIIEGIKNGVIDGMKTVLQSIKGLNAEFDLSTESLSKFDKLNNNLTNLAQYSAPPIVQGQVIPATDAAVTKMSDDLTDLLSAVNDQTAETITLDDLRTLLIDVARNYISSSFYLGDEQIARSANRGNLQLNRILGRA